MKVLLYKYLQLIGTVLTYIIILYDQATNSHGIQQIIDRAFDGNYQILIKMLKQSLDWYKRSSAISCIYNFKKCFYHH